MTDLEQQMLDFETLWSHRAGAKNAAIRAEFGVSAAVYYARLFAFIDTPEAEAADPMLVHRLRRLRDSRAAARAHREFLRA